MSATSLILKFSFKVKGFIHFRAHQRDIVSLAAYMAAFWNGVDLRFRQLKDPEVRLNIAGLVIATVRTFTINYIKNLRSIFKNYSF